MKLKSLLFGSAAVLAAGTGAQAADLPTAEPVEYVRICDAFGRASTTSREPTPASGSAAGPR